MSPRCKPPEQEYPWSLSPPNPDYLLFFFQCPLLWARPPNPLRRFCRRRRRFFGGCFFRGLNVQVWSKTNGFIAGFFSLFQSLEKPALFIPVREGERQPSFHPLTQVSYEEKPSLYPCDTSLPPKGNRLCIIVMQTSHERKPFLHSF